jgi:hypothetical protein
MISDAQEARMAEARAARNKQDRKIPLLINIKDFRLMPNVPRLGGQKSDKATGKPDILPHRDYRPYMGDPRATLEERRRIVETGSYLSRPAVVDSHPLIGNTQILGAPADGGEVEPFDVAKATRQELVDFALRYYGATIDEKGDTHLMSLRAQVKRLAEAATQDLT